MFAFIPFGLKILLASIIGGAISYVPGKSENNQSIIDTSLICIFSSSIIGLTKQYMNNGDHYSMGFGIFAVIMVSIFISKNLSFGNRMIWILSATIGIIIGSGLIVQAILLTTLVYYIVHNSDDVVGYIYKNNDISSKAGSVDE